MESGFCVGLSVGASVAAAATPLVAVGLLVPISGVPVVVGSLVMGNVGSMEGSNVGTKVGSSVKTVGGLVESSGGKTFGSAVKAQPHSTMPWFRKYLQSVASSGV